MQTRSIRRPAQNCGPTVSLREAVRYRRHSRHILLTPHQRQGWEHISRKSLRNHADSENGLRFDKGGEERRSRRELERPEETEQSERRGLKIDRKSVLIAEFRGAKSSFNRFY